MKKARIILNWIGMVGFIISTLSSILRSMISITPYSEFVAMISRLLGGMVIMAIPFYIAFVASCFMSVKARKGALLQAISVCIMLVTNVGGVISQVILPFIYNAYSDYKTIVVVTDVRGIGSCIIGMASLVLFAIGSLQCAQGSGKAIHIIALAFDALFNFCTIVTFIYMILWAIDLVPLNFGLNIPEEITNSFRIFANLIVCGVVLASRIVACVQANRVLKVANV